MQPEQIVDEIRSFVEAGQQGRVEEVKAVAEPFAALCEEVNNRLWRCNDALRRGQRSDAIRMAEVEPNLLDMFALLDFPDLPTWRRYCLDNGLLDPPILLSEQAAALNEAYAAEQPLQALLSQHRLLALGRAPLMHRLSVLRQIASMDPSADFWSQDVTTMERLRVDQMRTELRTAMKNQDAATVTRIAQEVSQPLWQTPPPADLVRSAGEAAQRLAAVRSLAELKALLPQLEEAYGAMSTETCRPLVSQWLATVASERLAVPEDLLSRAQTIIDWLAEQDDRVETQQRFNDACDNLQHAIDNDQPTPALDRAYRATLGFEYPLPEELERLYRQRLATRAAARRHKGRLIISGIAAAFVLVAGTAGYFGFQSMLTKEGAEVRQALAAALAEVQQGQLDQGMASRQQLSEQHPRVMQQPMVAQAAAEFDSAVADEKQRRADFADKIKTAISAGVDTPDDIDLKQASLLAKQPAEIAQVNDFTDRVTTARTHRQQDADHQFLVDAQALSQQIRQSAGDPSAIRQQLSLCDERVAELDKRSGVSIKLQHAEVTSLKAEIQQQQLAIDQQQSAAESLAQLSHSASAETQRIALKRYVATWPDDPRSASFRQAIEHADANAAVEEWAAMMSRWSNQLEPADIATATERAEAVHRFTAGHADAPMASAVAEYQAYLDTGLNVTSDAGPWKSQLLPLLKNPLVSDLKCLDSLNGFRFFVKPDVAVKTDGDIQEFNAILTPDLTSPTRVQLKGDSLLKSTTPAQSPQARFAAAAGAQLDAMRFGQWPTVGPALIDNLRSSSDMEPVLRAVLLEHVLVMNQSTASWAHEDGYATVAAALKALDVDDMEWLDPRHKPAADVKQKLSDAIDQLPTRTAFKATVDRRWEEMSKSLAFAPQAEGVLLRNDAGQFDVLVGGDKSSIKPGAVGWVVGPQSRMASIGRVSTDGKWDLYSGTGSATEPEGSLVFVTAK